MNSLAMDVFETTTSRAQTTYIKLMHPLYEENLEELKTWIKNLIYTH